MRIAMLGTRGVPAQYSGFETAVEEVGSRLVERGHEVIVYCRGYTEQVPVYRGMNLVHLPAVHRRSLETLTHTALSCIDALRRGIDVAIVFNCANSFLLPLLRARHIPVALHVDGLEWQRSKWGTVGKRYYKAAEAFGPRVADALIADARGIEAYYRSRYRVSSTYLPYGAPLRARREEDVILLAAVGVRPGEYHLVVARQEPENQSDVIILGYSGSQSRWPLLVVGGNPYPTAYTERLAALASGDPRVHLLGSIWDQELHDALYANCASYLHGHSVGGTNPALLRALGAGAPTVAYDVIFNREVCGDAARYFTDGGGIVTALGEAEASPLEFRILAEAGRERARTLYTWNAVADGYERLCLRLATPRHLHSPSGPGKDDA